MGRYTMLRPSLRATGTFLLALLVAAPALSASPAADHESQRLHDAKAAFEEILEARDAGVPKQLVSGCRCIAVFPGVLKGAVGWGARHGRGVVSCRDAQGRWSPPSFMTITGGSVGFQIGVEKTELVLFVMNEKGARAMVKSEFTLGAKGGLAAGPVGRTAEGGTDIKLDAEMYSYARSKGLFAGLSLEGARINNDMNAIGRFYGRRVDPQAILFEHRVPRRPAAVQEFVGALP